MYVIVKFAVPEPTIFNLKKKTSTAEFKTRFISNNVLHEKLPIQVQNFKWEIHAGI